MLTSQTKTTSKMKMTSKISEICPNVEVLPKFKTLLLPPIYNKVAPQTTITLLEGDLFTKIHFSQICSNDLKIHVLPKTCTIPPLSVGGNKAYYMFGVHIVGITFLFIRKLWQICKHSFIDFQKCDSFVFIPCATVV